MLTLRRVLIGLYLLLGIGLCLAVGLLAARSLSELQSAQTLARSNEVREQLARAALNLGDERTSAYLTLIGGQSDGRSVSDLRTSADAALAEAAATLAQLERPEAQDLLAVVQDELNSLRDLADAASSGAPDEQATTGAELLPRYSGLVDQLVSLRVALLAQEHPPDPDVAAAFQMRRYVSMMLENLSLNQALTAGLLANNPGQAAQASWDAIRSHADQAELAYGLLSGQTGISSRAVRLDLATLEVAYRDRYRPRERSLLSLSDAEVTASPVQTVRTNAYTMLWGARDVVRVGSELQESLFAYSRARLEAEQTRAGRVAAMWVVIFLLGLGAVAVGIRVVLHRIVLPLEHLRASMLGLANGDLTAALPAHPHKDEIGAMADTLRVFKVNALRRQRLQRERETLHAELSATYRQLRTDLEAASLVQSSLLPEPARLGQVAFAGRLSPSHFISGDTYDVLRQPNGPVHFFIADVAGHGAAAALVSMAARYAVTQSILSRVSGNSLAQSLTAMNADWPENLPYFTAILGELQPEKGQGLLVQAGHPPPLLLRSSGAVQMLGQGGLPIGILPDASYDEVSFAFGKGDRLVVYSDGLSEAESPTGEAFGEGRLADLVARHAILPSGELLDAVTREVQAWRQSEVLEDDMTLLVLEDVGADAL